MLAMHVAVVSSPGFLMSDPQRVMESQQRLITVGKAAVHWDEWQEDPRTIFHVRLIRRGADHEVR